MFKDSGFDKIYVNPVTIDQLFTNPDVDAPHFVSDIPVSSTQAVMTVPVNTEVLSNNTKLQSKGSIILKGLLLVTLTFGTAALIYHLQKQHRKKSKQ